jgi:hypothetical protein
MGGASTGLCNLQDCTADRTHHGPQTEVRTTHAAAHEIQMNQTSHRTPTADTRVVRCPGNKDGCAIAADNDTRTRRRRKDIEERRNKKRYLGGCALPRCAGLHSRCGGTQSRQGKTRVMDHCLKCTKSESHYYGVQPMCVLLFSAHTHMFNVLSRSVLEMGCMHLHPQQCYRCSFAPNSTLMD